MLLLKKPYYKMPSETLACCKLPNHLIFLIFFLSVYSIHLPINLPFLFSSLQQELRISYIIHHIFFLPYSFFFFFLRRHFLNKNL